MKFILKLLNRLGFLRYFNCITTIQIHSRTLKIPIKKGLGIKNLNQTQTWFTQLLNVFHEKHPNYTFIDIGANIGQTLIQVQAAASDWSYIGFEPNTNCVYYLKALIEINKMTKAKVFPFAISNKKEQLNLYMNSNTDTTATILDSFRPNVYNTRLAKEVQAINFDEFYKENLAKEDSYIVKIDIEGAEYLALQSMHNFIQQKRPILICEVLDTHSEDTYTNHTLHLEQMETFLDSINYDIYQVLRSSNDKAISNFLQVEKLVPKIWSVESIQLNDYLFIPNENKLDLNTLFNL